MKKNRRIARSRTFTAGEIAVIKSMIANDVKTPLKGSKGKQKTIGAKTGIKYHRSM